MPSVFKKRNLSQRRQDSIKNVLAFILLTCLGITMLLPFIWMVGTALKTHKELFVWPIKFFPDIPQWSNFIEAWNYSEMAPFGRFFLNSAIIAAVSTFGVVSTSLSAGYAFARLKFPHRDKLFLLYLATLMVPYQVTLVPLYIIMVKLGWVNTYEGLIIPTLVSAYGTFLAKQFISTIPRELEEAAIMDGASYPVIFWKIIIPLCKPVTATLLILSFMWSWNAFIWPLIITSSTELRTIPIGLAFFTSIPETIGYPQYQLYMAAATFSMLPTILIFGFFQKYFIQGISHTGLKG